MNSLLVTTTTSPDALKQFVKFCVQLYRRGSAQRGSAQGGREAHASGELNDDGGTRHSVQRRGARIRSASSDARTRRGRRGVLTDTSNVTTSPEHLTSTETNAPRDVTTMTQSTHQQGLVILGIRHTCGSRQDIHSTQVAVHEKAVDGPTSHSTHTA